jgi:hypothetical protein
MQIKINSFKNKDANAQVEKKEIKTSSKVFVDSFQVQERQARS